MPAPAKAYKDLTFLNSPAARTVRILCEYEEPRQRFRRAGIRDTIVFFGSARARPLDQAKAKLAHARRQLERATSDEERRRLEHQVKHAERGVRLGRFYEASRELSRRLTEWSLQRTASRRYIVCTGAGPGIMEAANRGASEVEGGQSVGLGISLPFEEKINPFVTEDLAFEFHYFFMRKYWFLYLAKAVVLFPGGFGTMDEMFEMLTLRQTGKVTKPLPTVLFGMDFWNDAVGFQKLVDWGTISEADLLLFHRSDTVDDAFEFLTTELADHEPGEPPTTEHEG